VIPAHPLALNARRTLDERRQRALTRYYMDAGARGLAIAVHTTQFAIRDARHALLEPVLSLGAEEARSWTRSSRREASAAADELVLIAGAVGPTPQAVREASLARDRGYHAVLLSLGALRTAAESELLDHCRAVGDVLPLVGFYLQPAVGGRVLSYAFWRAFLELPSVVAIKIAPFDRYRTLEVVRAVADSGRTDVALYTGNDDAILIDLLTPYRVGGRSLRFHGGLLGQFAVWTRRACELAQEARACSGTMDDGWLTRAAELTDANGALFDAANGFAGCIAGIHEALRRQGLLEGIWCLDEREGLSAGQLEEIDRVHRSYPHLRDDAYVAARRDVWLA
jgi:dihydrodipicolinate synthase/N-acetylneuraminate lyase